MMFSNEVLQFIEYDILFFSFFFFFLNQAVELYETIFDRKIVSNNHYIVTTNFLSVREIGSNNRYTERIIPKKQFSHTSLP